MNGNCSLALTLMLAASGAGCRDGTPANTGSDGGPEMRADLALPAGGDLGSGSAADQSGDELDALDGTGDALLDAAAVDRARNLPEAFDSAAGKLWEVGNDLGGACVEGARQACASPGNPLIGACHAGVRACEGGVWGGCSESLPAATESCNGIDDNCNGMIDEGCADGCIVVCASCAGSSDDGAVADGSPDRPFATLQAAIAARRPIDGGTHSRICVAGGTKCAEAWVYQSADPIRIPDGLIVQGGYAVTSTGLAYCDSPVRPRTTLEFTCNQGIIFDRSVTTGAELSGFVVAIRATATGSDKGPTVVVAVTGARNVSLGRIFVSDEFVGPDTYGISITDGGQANIVGSSINGGQGQSSAVGVYVSGGTVNLRNNCDDLVAGNCNSKCTDCGPQLGIRGYVAASALDAPARSSAVYVAGQPGSSVVGNMICGGSSGASTGAPAATSATVACDGPGCTTVSGNLIVGGGAQDSVGLAVVGADPWVDSNRVEGGCGTRSTTGIWLETSSARLQNNRILGGQCPGTGSPSFYGVQVISSGTSDHPDVHSNDIEPLGLMADCQSVGVLLDGSPGTEAGGRFRNNIIAAGFCPNRTAVAEAAGTARQLQSLANNDLYDSSPDPSAGSLILYRHGSVSATTIAQVNVQPGANGNVSVDPKYAAYLSDFRLTGESACIDHGTAEDAPGTDGDGNPRPAGAGYDIGAYEFR